MSVSDAVWSVFTKSGRHWAEVAECILGPKHLRVFCICVVQTGHFLMTAALMPNPVTALT